MIKTFYFLHYCEQIAQRDNVYFWDVSGSSPSFSLKSEIRGLELPRGTVLEIEIVHELQGEASCVPPS